MFDSFLALFEFLTLLSPPLAAQLLFEDCRHSRQEAHHHIRHEEDHSRRGAHLRLQVPHRGRQAAVLLRGEEVQKVHELKA